MHVWLHGAVCRIMCAAAQCASSVSCCSCCRELVHHSRLQGHPHIIGMREAYLTNDHLCVVMDYADGGDLAEHLSRHVYSTVRRPLLAQYMHRPQLSACCGVA